MYLIMLVSEMSIGISSSIMVRRREDVIAFITFIWSCTKFLVPKTNGLLLSYKSKKAVCLNTGS